MTITTNRTRPRRGLLGTAAAIVLAAAVGFAPGVAGADEDDGSISISPASGPVGTQVTITGKIPSVCDPDSNVSLGIGDLWGHQPHGDGSTDETDLGMTVASNRAFSLTATIPAGIGHDADGVGFPAENKAYPVNAYCWNVSLSHNPIESTSGSFTITEGSAPAPKVTVATTTISAGGAVSFEATGFAPDSEVTVELRSDPVTLGTVLADAAGNVAGTMTIPADTPAGEHTLVLSGTGADGAPLQVETAVTVTEPAPVETPAPVAPPAPVQDTAPAAPVAAQPSYTG